METLFNKHLGNIFPYNDTWAVFKAFEDDDHFVKRFPFVRLRFQKLELEIIDQNGHFQICKTPAKKESLVFSRSQIIMLFLENSKLNPATVAKSLISAR